MCKKRGGQQLQDFDGEKTEKKTDLRTDNIIMITLKFIFKEHAETLWTGPILISIGNNSDPFRTR
jgi:hypothetical protein